MGLNMYKNIIQKSWLCFLWLAILVVGNMPSAQADQMFFISPTRILLSDTEKVTVINVSNLSSVERAYTLSAEDIVMTSDGVTKNGENFPYSAKRMIRFVPRKFSIPAGGRQSVRIMAKFPEGTADGDYHCHLNFVEDFSKRQAQTKDNSVPRASMEAPVQYTAMIPVILSHGNVSATVKMLDPKISKSENPDRPYKLSMELSRKGNAQGVAIFDYKYIPPNGGAEISLGNKSTAYIYREVDKRTYSYEFQIPKESVPGGKLKVTMFDRNMADAEPIDQETLPVKF
jgi:P pilus assembly chaperone PapD